MIIDGLEEAVSQASRNDHRTINSAREGSQVNRIARFSQSVKEHLFLYFDVRKRGLLRLSETKTN
jgi:hypothetical protein